MSAVESLLRVMAYRDAEAIVLEAGRVPVLRRRGVAEALQLPPIDGSLLTEFAAPLLVGRTLEAGAVTATFVDVAGSSFPCTFEQVPGGLRIVARRGPTGGAELRPTSVATSAGPSVAPSGGTPSSASGPAPAPTSGGAEAAREAPTNAPRSLALVDGLARLARLLAEPFAHARERGASDVVLSTGQRPRLRIEGRIEPIDVETDDPELAACVLALGSNTDHGIELAGTRLRVNVFDHLGGYGLVARLVRDRVPTLAELGLPSELGAVVEHRDGLVLVCGPTGSGKSTTLASLVDLLDQRRAAHVITLEDPIEYRFAARRCLIHQREVGTHVPSFAAGLRAALREAPDVILLGELRDADTISAALTAAETGHLVLATLHAPNAVGAIDRMIDAFPDAQQRQARWQLAGALRTVITQYLLPRKDGGRAVAVEVVPVTAAVANIMRKGELHTLATAIQSGRDAGMIPLERSLAKLVESGVVSPQVVKRVASDPDLLAALTTKRS